MKMSSATASLTSRSRLEPRSSDPAIQPRVLILDDSATFRIMLAEVLAIHGYRPIEAGTGEEALRAALATPPDLAVIDLHLPGLSGADVIRSFRGACSTQLRELPIVGLSGRMGSERELVQAGADIAIRKPFREADLLNAIADARLRSRKRARDR
jgi:CheY-like chemotaxis protein